MVEGVTNGFTKTLEIVGVGYRASVQGDKLVMALGYSHPIEIVPPAGIKFEVEEKVNRIHVKGADKQLVGDVAADVRFRRPPEPYKGKGVKYQGEVIRRKVGKAGGKKK
jgi:large subunit ribosomal protein L6